MYSVGGSWRMSSCRSPLHRWGQASSSSFTGDRSVRVEAAGVWKAQPVSPPKTRSIAVNSIRIVMSTRYPTVLDLFEVSLPSDDGSAAGRAISSRSLAVACGSASRAMSRSAMSCLIGARLFGLLNQSQHFRTTSVSFCPPKPNELERHVSTCACRASFGT